MALQTSDRKLDIKLENDYMCENFLSPPPSPKHFNACSDAFVRFPPGTKIPLGVNFKPMSLKNTKIYVKTEVCEEKELKSNELHREPLRYAQKELSKFDLKQDGFATHCFVCENRVKPDNLKYHLYFGDLKCEACGKVITSCNKFASLKLGSRKENCKHGKMEWVFPPVDSLKRLLDEDEETFDESLTQYLKSLKRLKNIKPFKTAINYCNDYIKEKLNFSINKNFTEFEDDLTIPTNNIVTTDPVHVTVSSSMSQSNIAKGKTESKREYTNNCTVPTDPNFILETNTSEGILRYVSGKECHTHNYTVPTAPHSQLKTNALQINLESKSDSGKEDLGNKCTIPTVPHSPRQTNNTRSILISELDSGKEHHTNNCVGVTASHSPLKSNTQGGNTKLKFDSGKLEEPANEQTDLTASSSSLQTNSFERFLESNSDSRTEHKQILPALPEIGFYVIARKPLNECPNCYEFLDPKNMIFNSSYHQISTSCSNCSLLVIFIINPPDGSEHACKIFGVL